MEQHLGTGRWGQIYPESSDDNTNRSGQSHGPQAALRKLRNVCLYLVERSHIMRATVYATSSRPLHIEPASKKRNMDASGEGGVCDTSSGQADWTRGIRRRRVPTRCGTQQ